MASFLNYISLASFISSILGLGMFAHVFMGVPPGLAAAVSAAHAASSPGTAAASGIHIFSHASTTRLTLADKKKMLAADTALQADLANDYASEDAIFTDVWNDLKI
jgi:hypothetical protein